MNKYDKMVAGNKKESKEKVETAICAIHKMMAEQEKITIPKLVKRTGLSRGFFYKNATVRKEVDKAIEQQAGLVDSRKVIIDKAMEEKMVRLQVQVTELKQENENLKKENKKLKKSLSKKELNMVKNLI